MGPRQAASRSSRRDAKSAKGASKELGTLGILQRGRRGQTRDRVERRGYLVAPTTSKQSGFHEGYRINSRMPRAGRMMLGARDGYQDARFHVHHRRHALYRGDHGPLRADPVLALQGTLAWTPRLSPGACSSYSPSISPPCALPGVLMEAFAIATLAAYAMLLGAYALMFIIDLLDALWNAGDDYEVTR